MADAAATEEERLAKVARAKALVSLRLDVLSAIVSRSRELGRA
jgi:hypothetical protein